MLRPPWCFSKCPILLSNILLRVSETRKHNNIPASRFVQDTFVWSRLQLQRAHRGSRSRSTAQVSSVLACWPTRETWLPLWHKQSLEKPLCSPTFIHTCTSFVILKTTSSVRLETAALDMISLQWTGQHSYRCCWDRLSQLIDCTLHVAR